MEQGSTRTSKPRRGGGHDQTADERAGRKDRPKGKVQAVGEGSGGEAVDSTRDSRGVAPEVRGIEGVQLYRPAAEAILDDLKARIVRREQWGKSVDRAEQELFVAAMTKLRQDIDRNGLSEETLSTLKEIAALSNDMKKAYEEAVTDTMQHIAGREDSLLRTYSEVRRAEAEHGTGPDPTFGGTVNGVAFSSPKE